MLRACHRVLKPGGALAFFVVAVAGGLSPRDRERAIESGPEHVGAESGYPELMAGAGFADVEIVDVTDGYAATLSDSLRAREARSDRLEALLGAEDFAEGQANRRTELAAVHDGLLKRYLISTVRPG